MIQMTEKFNQYERRTIVLIVTHRCNLNCKYCYESHKDNQCMTLETAQQILEHEFQTAAESKITSKLKIDFLGGEPLICFDLIKNICEWIWSKPRSVEYELMTRTNGLLLNENMKHWLFANRDRFVMGLSMDGISAMNAINRCKQMPDYKFFLKNWPSHPVKMVLYSKSVHLLSESIIYMHENKIPVIAEIGAGFEWDSKSVSVFRKQMLELVDYYLSHPDIQPVMPLFSQSFLNFYFDNETDNNIGQTSCGECTNMVAYDCDGQKYFCNLFTPMVMGDNLAQLYLDAYPSCSITASRDADCKDCPTRRICTNCLAWNILINGDIAKSAARKTTCLLWKAKTEMEAYWVVRQTQQHLSQSKMLTRDDVENAKIAIKVVEYFSSHFNYLRNVL